MGYSILELVLRRLREGKFIADAAYPGQKFPKIKGPVAAVHIEKVDRASMTVTVEVSIVSPAAMGGTACEVEALRATEILRWSGAVCVQNACTYDGVAQVYVVNILATFTGVTEADDCEIGPGFMVYFNQVIQPYIQVVEERGDTGFRAEYAIGEKTPAGISQGKQGWTLTLEEQVFAGTPEPAEPRGEFEVLIITAGWEITYTSCRWTDTHRIYDRNGMRRVRTCTAMDRKEVRRG